MTADAARNVVTGMAPHVVIGTAGHIDHGKTALVRALTGTDTDRLAEEKRRGITIDLGFARMALSDGGTASIVDVPGHEDFIRNMVAGAAGIDVALLVVAADEGVMPQTREHLAILRMLDVRAAVLALTKVDLVDAEWLELATDDLRAHVAGTAYANSPIVPVSARSGAGIDALRTALAGAAQVSRAPGQETGLFRMPVDRAFVIHGTGTVVTGTVREGTLDVGADVRVLPDGRLVRVRGLQHHGDSVDRIGAGMRAAVALTGIERDAVARGSWIVNDGWDVTSMLTAHVELSADTAWELRSRQRVRVHIGTAEVMARALLLDGVRLGPGESGWAQLRLESPVIARYGDRFVLRSWSPVTTIGGGRVLEPLPPRRRRLDAAARHLLGALDRSGLEALEASVIAAGAAGLSVDELPVRLGLPAGHDLASHGIVRTNDRLVGRALLESAESALVEAIDDWHGAFPLRPGMDRSEARRRTGLADDGPADLVIDRAVERGALRVVAGLVARAGFAPRASGDQQAARDRLVEIHAAAGAAPPRLEELPPDLAGRSDLRDLLGLLEREGVLRPFPPDRWIHAEALEHARTRLRDALGGRDDLGPADFRSVFDLPRRHLIPLLELFDRLGWTRREGDRRAVPGEGAPDGPDGGEAAVDGMERTSGGA